MKSNISFSEVQNRYNSLLPEISAKKSQSTSKSKDTPLDQCRWELNWDLHFRLQSATETFDQIFNKPKKEPILDVDEELCEKLSHVSGITLVCKAGRGSWYARIELDKFEMPPEIIEQHRIFAEKEVSERKRIASLTPEQKEAETRRLLSKLSNDPGFTVVRIKKAGTDEGREQLKP